mmetsp:Transcript_7249/g.14738  ORF Transcript_7249/g.14738 Transcript_7249/m.14738 type:complete len:210 (-) Transcript_7249:20-649(-)
MRSTGRARRCAMVWLRTVSRRRKSPTSPPSPKYAPRDSCPTRWLVIQSMTFTTPLWIRYMSSPRSPCRYTYRAGMSVRGLRPTQSSVRKMLSTSLMKGTFEIRSAYMFLMIRHRISNGSCMRSCAWSYGFSCCRRKKVRRRTRVGLPSLRSFAHCSTCSIFCFITFSCMCASSNSTMMFDAMVDSISPPTIMPNMAKVRSATLPAEMSP